MAGCSVASAAPAVHTAPCLPPSRSWRRRSTRRGRRTRWPGRCRAFGSGAPRRSRPRAAWATCAPSRRGGWGPRTRTRCRPACPPAATSPTLRSCASWGAAATAWWWRVRWAGARQASGRHCLGLGCGGGSVHALWWRRQLSRAAAAAPSRALALHGCPTQGAVPRTRPARTAAASHQPAGRAAVRGQEDPAGRAQRGRVRPHHARGHHAQPPAAHQRGPLLPGGRAGEGGALNPGLCVLGSGCWIGMGLYGVWPSDHRRWMGDG